jgi:20S proteasome alpha/beta subunit
MNSATMPVNRPGIAQKPYTPEKSQRPKAMTIALAFPYLEGVLVCADTQMSYPTGTKYVEHKITAEEIDECRYVFAFAGDLGLATEIRTKNFRQIARFIKETRTNPVTEEFHAIVEAATNEYKRLEIDLGIEFLLAVYPPSESPAIVHFDGRSVNVKTDEIVVLGCGNDGLTRYLTENLFIADLDWEHALSLGSYVVKKATQYVQKCGEPIDAVRLAQSSVWEVDRQNVDWACTRVESQEVQMHKWLFKRV